jgi:hypothetical protein
MHTVGASEVAIVSAFFIVFEGTIFGEGAKEVIVSIKDVPSSTSTYAGGVLTGTIVETITVVFVTVESPTTDLTVEGAIDLVVRNVDPETTVENAELLKLEITVVNVEPLTTLVNVEVIVVTTNEGLQREVIIDGPPAKHEAMPG